MHYLFGSLLGLFSRGQNDHNTESLMKIYPIPKVGEIGVGNG